jgi:hypothetical protein
MKHIYFLLFCSFFTCCEISAQTTATDFTLNDCNGVSHHLFSELDEGKIIVAAFVMPCGSCGGPALAAYNAVQSYSGSHPDRVFFYLVDDYANTSCSTLTNWGNTNAMPQATKFSNAGFSMIHYGTPGMPKIIVLGGTNHTVAYNQNSGVTTSGVQNAINGLLTAGTETFEMVPLVSKVIPNPVTGPASFEFSLAYPSKVLLSIYSLSGALVFQNDRGNFETGSHRIPLAETDGLEKGLYLLKLETDRSATTTQFVIQN